MATIPKDLSTFYSLDRQISASDRDIENNKARSNKDLVDLLQRGTKVAIPLGALRWRDNTPYVVLTNQIGLL